MNLIEKFDELCNSNDSFDLKEQFNDAGKKLALFSFYHYMNGDITTLDDLPNYFCYKTPSSFVVSCMFISPLSEDNTLDFLCCAKQEYFESHNNDELMSRIEMLSSEIGKVVYNDINSDFRIQNLFDFVMSSENLDPNNCFYNVKILCDWEVDPILKIKLQRFVSGIEVKNRNLTFELLFLDDIQQEINDYESPQEYVSKGLLNIYGNATSCYIGEEGSFITLVSANSLKDLYFQYSTRGLFASNLRYFINSKSIDPKIADTIKNDSDNFAYYNNGIIVTCDDCLVRDNVMILSNFSIVNGGQTTNLIGRTQFEKDFPVVCKIIKNKYDNPIEKVEFLSKVAEASNTQKPIKAQDLIANRIEQRLLKIQFSECGIFLKVKRGEKINKMLYPEPWQNAENVEFAQALFSCIYQGPGSAKNSRSKLLSDEKIYDLLFKNQYSNAFLISLQHIKVQFSNWTKTVKKTESKISTKYGLSKYSDLLILGIIGLIQKVFTNSKLREEIRKKFTTNSDYDNDDFKYLLRQNDIGKLPLLKMDLISSFSKKSLGNCFDFIFSKIVIPAFEVFKRRYPTYSYNQFNKSDKYYYNYVVPAVFNAIKHSKDELVSNLGVFFNLFADSSLEFKADTSLSENRPGLLEELKKYRNDISKRKDIPAYMVFKNVQLEYLVRYHPKSNEDLIAKCYFSQNQVFEFGHDIITIIKKYSDTSDFKVVQHG